MSRLLVTVVPALLVACAEPLDPAALDTGFAEEARAVAASHDGSVKCGEQNTDVYKNSSAGDVCVHATFTNHCTSDLDVDPAGGDTEHVDTGKTQTFSFTIPTGKTIQMDCDGSDESETCGGCSWSLSFGAGACAIEAKEAEPLVF